jgi:hypothetical protein
LRKTPRDGLKSIQASVSAKLWSLLIPAQEAYGFGCFTVGYGQEANDADPLEGLAADARVSLGPERRVAPGIAPWRSHRSGRVHQPAPVVPISIRNPQSAIRNLQSAICNELTPSQPLPAPPIIAVPRCLPRRGIAIAKDVQAENQLRRRVFKSTATREIL